MTLHDSFHDAINRAHQAALGGAPAGALDATVQLHQMIIGPRGSGKSTAAQKYATALAAEKFAQPERTVTLACDSAPDKNAFEDALARAQGGVLILDNAQTLSRDFHGYDPIALIKGAMEDRACVIVLVGETAGMEEMTRAEPGLKRRLNVPVHLGRRLSQDEIAAYNAAEAEEKRRDALSPEARAAEDEKRRTAAEWAALDKVDVASNAQIRPMRTVRFGKER